MKRLFWMMGVCAMVVMASLSFAGSAVPEQFIGIYVGEYEGTTGKSSLTLNVSGNGALEVQAREPGNPGGEAYTEGYAGTVAEDGTFTFTRNSDPRITFDGRIIVTRMIGVRSIMGTPEGKVRAKLRK